MDGWAIAVAVAYAGASTAMALALAEPHWRAKSPEQPDLPAWMFVVAGLLWPVIMPIVLAGAVRVAWHVRKLRKMK